MTKKCYVLIISTDFPKTHKRAGNPTDFFTKILDEVKLHTLRKNYPFWKKRVDEINAGKAYLSVRCWEGQPYKSKQMELIEFSSVGIQKLEKSNAKDWCHYLIDGVTSDLTTAELAKKDGLSYEDFQEWFKKWPSEPMAIIHFTDFRYFYKLRLRGLFLQKGYLFTGKWFTGLVEVLEQKGNDLEVKLRSQIHSGSYWYETWNLEHTKVGFKNGDYFTTKETMELQHLNTNQQ